MRIRPYPQEKIKYFIEHRKEPLRHDDKDLFLEYIDLYLINPADFIHEDTHIDILLLFISTETAID